MLTHQKKGRIGEIEKYVASRLRLIRYQRRLTFKALASIINVSTQQIVKYETGVNRISIGKLLLLSEAFSIDVSWFYRGYEEIPSEQNRRASLGKEEEYPEIAEKFYSIKSPECRSAVSVIIGALSRTKVF